jgi:F-type H+-transporting ATPase subunit b
MRTVTLRGVIVGLWAGLSVAGAWAAEGSEPGGNPVNLDLWQAGYTIVVFLCLAGILAKFAFRPILASLKKREDFIRHSLEEAQQNREQAEARLKEYQAKLEEAQRQAATIVDEARRGAETSRKRIEEEARHKSDEMIERAKREIGLARDAALRSLFDESAELAASLAAAALHREMTPEEHQRLVIEALRGLQAHERALQ